MSKCVMSDSFENTFTLQGYCVPGCAEDIIGFTFYKYVLTNVVSINGVETLSALAYKCLHMTSHVDPPWVSPCSSLLQINSHLLL